MKKLLLISYDFPPKTGGIARLCNEIAVRMTRNFSQVEVLTASKDSDVAIDRMQGVSVMRFPDKRPLLEGKLLGYLRRIKNKQEYTVLCGLWYPEAFLARLAGFKNIYILAHGAELLSGNNLFREKVWHKILGNWVLGKAKKVIANSRYTGDLIKRVNTSSKIEILPLAVDHEFFRPPTTPKGNDILRICTVSRIVDFKGHDFILNSLEHLPEDLLSKIEWHIAGTGPYSDQLKENISKSKLHAQVVMHGFVEDKSLPKFYGNSDLFVLMTKESNDSHQVEGFGLVFLEAQSCGIPVIGSNTGGIFEAIAHGNGGWLIQQDDSEAFVALISSFIRNKDLLVEEGKKARTRVLEECTYDKYITSLNLILQN